MLLLELRAGVLFGPPAMSVALYDWAGWITLFLWLGPRVVGKLVLPVRARQGW